VVPLTRYQWEHYLLRRSPRSSSQPRRCWVESASVPEDPTRSSLATALPLNGGTLSSSLDVGSLSVQTTLSPTDQIIVTNAGTPQLLGLDQVRELFTAGTNIAIDASGVISASAYGLSALSTVVALASGTSSALVRAVTTTQSPYGNFLDGLTIDLAEPANTATDTDTFWVAQTSKHHGASNFGSPVVMGFRETAKVGNASRLELSANHGT